MRRTLAAFFVAVVTFAAGSPLTNGNNCCCKTSCPMKRAMRCQTNACTLASTIVTVTIVDGVLSRPPVMTAPRTTESLFATPQARRISFERPPETPPPRAAC